MKKKKENNRNMDSKELKKCAKCEDSFIGEEGIYCERLDRWVGRSSEQSCVIEKSNTTNSTSN